MRIISGIAKGFKLKVPKDEKIRPTTEKAKEALSRGASHVFFVDYFKESLRTIDFNLGRVKKIFARKFSVVNKDAILFLKSNKEIFDVVYLDPPYDKEIIPEVLANVANFVSHGGMVICEHSRKDILPESLEILKVFKVKSYGSVSVTFYKKENFK